MIENATFKEYQQEYHDFCQAAELIPDHETLEMVRKIYEANQNY